MTDSTLNRFISAGTAAARAAFTPSPPTPAAGAAQGYFWHETDTGDTYSWKAGTGWIKVNSGSFTAASTTEQLTGTDTAKGSTPDSVAALWEQGADVASAGTTSLGEGGYFSVTGTTTITDIDFATDKAGRAAWVKFVGILTLTHNASTLILPTGANITTTAGDTACFVSEGSDVVRCVAYNRASGAALASTAGAMTLLETQSPSGASTIDIESFAGGGYAEVMIVCILTLSTDATSVQGRSKHNGTYQTAANYHRTGFARDTANTGSDVGTTTGTAMLFSGSAVGFSVGNDTTENYTAIIHIRYPDGATKNKRINCQSEYSNASAGLVMFGGAGMWSGTDSTLALQGLRILFSAGTATGTVKVFGAK